jgi:hypothetical protein
MKQTDHEAICCLTRRVKDLEAENKHYCDKIRSLEAECERHLAKIREQPTRIITK